MDMNGESQRYNPSVMEGLTEQEVSRRKEEGLVNIAQESITKTKGQIIKDNVWTLFNAFNLVIGICLALVGAYTNMAYLLIIIVNVSIGIIQEIHAKKMVEDLSLLGASKAVVVRSGKEFEIAVEELVLDDMTILGLGSQVCSDSIVMQGQIEVNESLLTGESDPVIKKPGDSLLSGSFVISGKCYAKVAHVGADNFATKLTQGAKKHKQINSELLNSMRKVTKFTSYFIVPIGILLFLEAYVLRSDTMANSVISTAAALLGMLPKGLVLLISTSLVVGIIKLSKKNVLVQNLYALETLAHVDMLCLDKTGTITEGKMRVSGIYPVDVTVMPISVEQAVGRFVGVMEDNNATFMALKDYFTSDMTYKPIHRTPFSSDRKWSSATFEDIGTIIIGAPEKILRQSTNSDSSDTMLPSEAAAAQELGKRILCLGFTPTQQLDDTLPGASFVAAIEFSDPIRKDAKETLAFFKQEDVEVKIISGDNPLTVSSIAKQAGLTEYRSYIDMSEVHLEEEIAAAAEEYSIFGRVSPNQKSQLVKALQSKGHTVAMTGDGVNDVLALKEADLSIAMASGSDAARQVSKLVLLDSDFTAIPDVVMEGRRVVNNITRFGGVFLVKTIYSILLAIYSVITLTAFPFSPIQITLYDGVIEGYPSFLLSFEPSRKRIEGNFLRSVITQALPYSLLILLNIIVTTQISPAMGISRDEAVTVMYYLTSLAGILAVFRACRPFNKIRAFVSITATIGFYLAAYLFSGLLHLQPLTMPALKLLAVLVVLCVPVRILFTILVERFQSKFMA